MKKAAAPVLLVDSHVHIYPCYDTSTLFDGVHANFCEQSAGSGHQAFASVLLLTESAGHEFFLSLLNRDKANESRGGWRVLPTEEAHAVVLQREDQARIFVIAGRQIETRERIEVSALLTRESFTDGRSLQETLDHIRAAGALAVLPWGVGKWLGQRGRLLAEAVDRDQNMRLLGDNGSRPFFWPRPRLFGLAERLGGKVIAGSDPLPIPGDERRIGTFGVCLPGPIDAAHPGASIRGALVAHGPSPQRFGKLQGLRTFVKHRQGLKSSSMPSRDKPRGDGGATETPDIETSSEDYAKRFAGSVGAYMLRVQADALAKVLSPSVGKHVLDVGGGHGQLTGQLLENGFTVTVLASDECCRQRLKAFETHPNFAFTTGNLLAMPFADRSFDCLISVRLVSHIENRKRLFAEFCRVAKHTVVIDYPSWYSLNALTPLLFGLKKLIEHNTRTYHSFSGRKLAAQFAEHGFESAARAAQFFLPMFLHRWFGASSLLQKLEQWAQVTRLTSLLGSPVILRLDRRLDT